MDKFVFFGEILAMDKLVSSHQIFFFFLGSRGARFLQSFFPSSSSSFYLFFCFVLFFFFFFFLGEWVTYNIYGLVGHFTFRPAEFFRGLGVILETQVLKCYKLCILLKSQKKKIKKFGTSCSINGSICTYYY